MPDYFAHESAIIDANVQIGAGTKIWHFSHVLSGTAIGERCSFGQNCVVGPRVKMGNGIKVQNNVSVYEGVEVEDDCFLGPSMVFTNVFNPRAFIERKDPANPENFGGVGLTGSGVGEPVELVRLDDLGLRQCRLIKVDIEGLELEALHGGTRLIEVHRPVLYVECDRPGMQEPLTAFLEKIGYRVFLHRPPLFSPNNFRRCETNLFPGLVSGNLLALPAGESPPSDAVLIDGAMPQAQR